MGDMVDVTVGIIGRPHGVRGDVFIDLRTDEPGRRFAVGTKLSLGESGRTVEIATVRWNRGRLMLTFLGYPDRTTVEPLVGQSLAARVPADERPSEAEEYFDRQLVGLAVLDHAGSRVGIVREVLHLPAQDVLEVAVEGGERLVPFVSALVPEVDLAAGHVRLADVEGLLEDIE